MSYAKIVKQIPYKSKDKKVPKLIIEETDQNDNTNIGKTVYYCIAKNKTIQIKKVTIKNNDLVITNYMSLENVKKIEKTRSNCNRYTKRQLYY